MRLPLPLLLPLALATPTTLPRDAVKPVYWLLAGDSTTAHSSGWGDAFLSTTVAQGSSGHNWAKGGATTASFRAQGYWTSVKEGITKYKPDHRVYVTIQFGHNDQKANSGVSLAQYTANLGAFADEVVAAGATPILVTPLTRRTFNATTKKVVENLANERAKTIEVAKKKNLHYIDLNKASTEYVNAIGSRAADKYNLAFGDRTHLNEWGGVVFSRIVSDLLVDKYPAEFKDVTVANTTLSATIKAGKAA